jgi:hypothetical protein
MQTSLLLAAVVVLAASASAQEKSAVASSGSVAETRVVTATRAASQPDHHFHAHFANSCCLTINPAPASDDSVSPLASVEIVHAQGGPDWQPSNFMTFQQAVTLGQEQAALAPGFTNRTPRWFSKCWN